MTPRSRLKRQFSSLSARRCRQGANCSLRASFINSTRAISPLPVAVSSPVVSQITVRTDFSDSEARWPFSDVVSLARLNRSLERIHISPSNKVSTGTGLVTDCRTPDTPIWTSWPSKKPEAFSPCEMKIPPEYYQTRANRFLLAGFRDDDSDAPTKRSCFDLTWTLCTLEVRVHWQHDLSASATVCQSPVNCSIFKNATGSGTHLSGLQPSRANP